MLARTFRTNESEPKKRKGEIELLEKNVGIHERKLNSLDIHDRSLNRDVSNADTVLSTTRKVVS
jgi:hypothetical protein